MTRALTRRVATAAALATLLGGGAFAPGASATPVDDLIAVVTDYAGDGDVTPCRFTRVQLESVRGQISPDLDSYAPDFRLEVNREIERWASGGCSTGTSGGGGSGGGSGGGTNGGNGGGSGGGKQGAHRASIVSTTVAGDRRSVKVKLRCPAAASSACVVTLAGSLAGRSSGAHRSFTISRGSSKTVTLKLSKTIGNRLSTAGGKLKVTARTAGSSLGPATHTVKISPRP